MDPGLSCTGYAVIDTNPRLSIVELGVIRTKASQDIAERVMILFNDLTGLIKDTRPVKAAVETVFVGKNVSSALKLGQARGALITAIANSGLKVKEFSPREVKKNVTGTGTASKEQVLFMVKKILKLDKIPGPLDASDALAIAYSCYLTEKISGRL